MYQVYTEELTSPNLKLKSQLYKFLSFFGFWFFCFLGLCLSVVPNGEKNKTNKNHQKAHQQELLACFSCSHADGNVYCKAFTAMIRESDYWVANIQNSSNMSSHRPVLARFIPLELKGDILPLGPGLSSLKFEFIKANSRNCCLLI